MGADEDVHRTVAEAFDRLPLLGSAAKTRHLLELDYVPSGVDPVTQGERTDDNIVYDIAKLTGKSKSGWGHPSCSDATEEIAKALPRDYPIRSVHPAGV